MEEVDAPVFQCPILPYPHSVFLAEKAKSDAEIRIRLSDQGNWERSYESLRKGLYDDEEAEFGLRWDCQVIPRNEEIVKEVDGKGRGGGRAVKRKKSRTLVKLRQPGDRRPRAVRDSLRGAGI